jgi:hypothetical protein
MKKLSLLAVLFAFGCGASEPEPERPEAGPAPAARGGGGDQIRSQIALKNSELRQADIDLGKIMAERLELDAKPASEAKTNRLAELGKIESETKLKKQALEADIAALERKAQDSGAASKPKSADEALDLALAAEDSKLKEEEAKRRAKAQADAGADKKRLDEAEKARVAETAAREKEKIQAGQGGTAPATADGPTFEERWAGVILRVRTELQRYKRW